MLSKNRTQILNLRKFSVYCQFVKVLYADMPFFETKKPRLRRGILVSSLAKTFTYCLNIIDYFSLMSRQEFGRGAFLVAENLAQELVCIYWENGVLRQDAMSGNI